MEMFKKSVLVLILVLSNSFDFQQFVCTKERSHDTSRSETTVLSRDSRSVAAGLEVFAVVLGLVAIGYSIADKIQTDQKMNDIINKLNTVNDYFKKLSWTAQYSEPEQHIQIAYDKRELFYKNKDRTTAASANDYYVKDFMAYMKKDYSEAGLRIYNGIFSEKKIFGSNLFKDKPENKNDCYNFHSALLMLLGKAAVVELSYDLRYKITSDAIVKAKAETWKARFTKLQNNKEELCETSKKSSNLLHSSGWVFTSFLSVMLTFYVIN